MSLLILMLTACGPDETISGYADPEAVYQLVEINGAPVTQTATLRFPAEGTVAGQGPCNTFSGDQTAPYPWIEIGPLAATRRACPDLAFETLYLRYLERVTIAEAAGAVLILSTDSGDTLVFTASAIIDS